MNVLDRRLLITTLQPYAAGQQPPAQLAPWAFDQFCDQEEGLLVYEPGYHQVITGVLDALMFADNSTFGLAADQVAALIAKLTAATFDADEAAREAADDDD